LSQHVAADDGEDGLKGKAMTGEETIVGRPIVELLAASSEEAGNGVAAETEQTAQGEGLSAEGETVLGEGGEAFCPELLEGGEDAGRVFFRREAGVLRRRRTSRLLSSMDHSTVSPREKSMA
jgi:hypothetical protein